MRILCVVGGIFSGIGKGIAAASIAKILKEYGFSVTAVKIDPYINYDAGTLRPTEHGEVWVTDDGGEIDQDLGNYERFIGTSIPKKNNITTGQVYWKIIRNERKGKYLGQTVQFIPHVPNEIKRRIREAGLGHDFVIVEIGGVVGDYENLPFLFAMKSFEVELGRENVAYALVTYLPVPEHLGEMKTKPTQQAIRLLNETGIFPDFVIARATQPLDDVRKRKIETYANIDISHVIAAPDVRSAYEVPLNFEKENLGIKLLKRFNLQPRILPDWSRWTHYVTAINSPTKRLRIAMVGKYVSVGDFALQDSYISINQALEHAGAELDLGAQISWIDSTKLDASNVKEKLENFHGVIVPGGFGSSGVDGKLAVIRHCRENGLPYLGLCFGMQLAVVEFSRSVAGLEDAHTTEIDPKTTNPVIDVMPEQQSILQKARYGATMRLGAYAANLQAKSRIATVYEATGRMERDRAIAEMLKQNGEEWRLGLLEHPAAIERHRHRFEVNPQFVKVIEQAGLAFSGWHSRMDGQRLMEFIELPKHPCFIATQAHPEFKSRLGDPSPMFFEFLRASGE